jgi:hypothetical protein
VEAGDYRKAMFAARLSAALEDETRGDELTDSILQDQTVQQLVQEIHRNPKQYVQLVRLSDWSPADLFLG